MDDDLTRAVLEWNAIGNCKAKENEKTELFERIVSISNSHPTLKNELYREIVRRLKESRDWNENRMLWQLLNKIVPEIKCSEVNG